MQAAVAAGAARRDVREAAAAGAVARTLTGRAAAWGRDAIGDSDTGRRLPLALLGLLDGARDRGHRAARRPAHAPALLTALVLLSMPLLVLQSRQLTSEIGTAAGAALVFTAWSRCASRARVLGIVELGVGARRRSRSGS